MLWIKIVIIIVAVAVIIVSIPKLKTKFDASSQETKDKIMLYVPLVLAVIGAVLLIGVVR